MNAIATRPPTFIITCLLENKDGSRAIFVCKDEAQIDLGERERRGEIKPWRDMQPMGHDHPDDPARLDKIRRFLAGERLPIRTTVAT